MACFIQRILIWCYLIWADILPKPLSILNLNDIKSTKRYGRLLTERCQMNAWECINRGEATSGTLILYCCHPQLYVYEQVSELVFILLLAKKIRWYITILKLYCQSKAETVWARRGKNDSNMTIHIFYAASLTGNGFRFILKATSGAHKNNHICGFSTIYV